MFQLALLNPLRFIDTYDVNNSFDGDFAINQLLFYQDKESYLQKWQNSDTIKLQLLSDFEPSEISMLDCKTGIVTHNIEWQPQPTQIEGFDFVVYEIALPLLAFAQGEYYFEFSYDDENGNIHVLESEPISIKQKQPRTILLAYKNSENDFDVIFDTNIEFTLRVEGAIKGYLPGTDRNVYTDQMVNPTSVFAMPFRKFKFYIGAGKGVPDWVFDKVVRALALDQVYFDGVKYQVADEADYEVERNDEIKYIGGSIDVRPTDNKFGRYITTSNSNQNSFIPMQKVLKYFNRSADIAIAGFFKNYTLLEKICISKRSAPDITINIGTSAGASDIAFFEGVQQGQSTLTIEELFQESKTLHISGLDGSDVDVLVVYKQLDEAPISLAPSATPSEGKGSTKLYTEVTPGDLAIHFNIATGLGDSNGPYKDWAWMDGRNGTPDWTDRVPFMTDDIANLGQLIGSNAITLTKDQLPAEGVHMFSSNVGGVGGQTPNPDDYVARARLVGSQTLNYELVKGTVAPLIGKTANLGIGAPIDIRPAGVKSLWIMKLSN